jgi:hypothetical protein
VPDAIDHHISTLIGDERGPGDHFLATLIQHFNSSKSYPGMQGLTSSLGRKYSFKSQYGYIVGEFKRESYLYRLEHDIVGRFRT